MKMITAVIQPFMLTKVTHVLEEIAGFPGMTVTAVEGFGRGKSEHDKGAPHRVIEDLVEYVKKARVEIAARDEMVDEIVETIARTGHTGQHGDGKVFVWPIEHAVRIRTGETGDAAL